MVQIIEKRPITLDGRYRLSPINGRIIKVAVKTPKPIPTLTVRMKSSEGEIIIDHVQDNNIMIYHPYHVVDYPTVEFPRTEYFYTWDSVVIEIEGLQNGEYIESVRIYFD